MKIGYFAIDSPGLLRSIPHEEAAARWSGEGAPIWIDAESADHDFLNEKLEAFGLSPFMLERCLRVGEATQIIPSPEAVYLELVVFTDSSRSNTTNVGILCLEGVLITLHSEGIHSVDHVHAEHSGFVLSEPTTSDLLVSLLLLKTEEAAGLGREIRAKVTALDSRMDRDPGSVKLDEILDVKQSVSRLIAVSEEQEECFDVLSSTASQVVDFTSLQDSVKLLSSLSGSVNRRADRMVADVADLRQRYEMNQQERTNHRLAILTVISAVFLPLSLIAGIWGMNFDYMPGMHHPLSYPAGLTFMALVAGGMTWGFYKRGWLK